MMSFMLAQLFKTIFPGDVVFQIVFCSRVGVCSSLGVSCMLPHSDSPRQHFRASDSFCWPRSRSSIAPALAWRLPPVPQLGATTLKDHEGCPPAFADTLLWCSPGEPPAPAHRHYFLLHGCLPRLVFVGSVHSPTSHRPSTRPKAS